MSGPLSFASSDERDECLANVHHLDSAARLLPMLARDPELVRYRLTAAGSDVPMLPSPAEAARAVEALQQAAACLRDHYRQRARYDDDPDPWRERDSSLDDEVAF